MQVISATWARTRSCGLAPSSVADFDEAPTVGYQETACQGQFVDRREDVGVLIDCWDTLVREALPWAASQALLEEAAKSWTSSDVTWRKASYSGGNGGECIEVGVWRKATHSGGNGGGCVEVADTPDALVPPAKGSSSTVGKMSKSSLNAGIRSCARRSRGRPHKCF